MQNGMWRLALRKARGHMRTAPSDALITAACVTYHGPMDEATRTQLLADWLNRYVCTIFFSIVLFVSNSQFCDGAIFGRGTLVSERFYVSCKI